MKHGLLHLIARMAAMAVIALSAITAHADVSSFPYRPSYSQLSADGWQGYSSNSYQATVTVGYSSTQNIKVERNKSCSARTRVFSPALEIKAGSRYTFSFAAAAINPNAAMTITPYITSEVVKSILTSDGVADKLLMTGETVNTSNATKKTVELTYTPQENSTVYLMIDITTDNSASRTMYMSDFEVTELLLESKPEPVEKLALAVVDNDARRIKLSWINPTHTMTGNVVDIASVNISRNSEPLAIITDPKALQPGAEASFEDIPEVSGEYEYTITVTDTEGKESSPASVRSPYVGRPEAITVPYTFDFSNNALNSFWTINTQDSANGWEFSRSYSSYYLQCLLDGYKPTGSTATTPEIELDCTKAYTLTYTAQCTNRINTFSYSVLLEGDSEGEPWQVTLSPEAEFMPSANGTDESISLTFSPPHSGQARISFTAMLAKLSATYYSNTFKITSMSIEETPVVPSTAIGLTAVSDPDGELNVAIAWTNPSLTETGLPIGDMTASILRDGTEITTVDAIPGAAGTFTDTAVLGLSSGYHTYSVIICNANGHSGQPAPEATTGYTGGPTDLPYTSDFNSHTSLYLPVRTDQDAAGATFSLVDGKFSVKANPKSPVAALMAPLFNLETGRVYEITVETSCSGGYYDIDYDIALAPRTDPSDHNSVIGYSRISYNKASSYNKRFAIEAGGEYFPVIILKPTGSYGSDTEYNITAINFCQAPLLPAPVNDLNARSRYSEGYVELSWTMPNVSPEGVVLSGDLTGKLYRGCDVTDDTEPVYTVEATPGASCTWNDTEATVGINTYTLVIHSAEGSTGAMTITSDYHAAAMPLPYSCDFTTEAGRAVWTFIDDSSSSYKGSTFHFNDNNEIYLLDGTSPTSGNSAMNDWIVSPLFEMEPEVIYTLNMEAKGPETTSTYYLPSFEAYLGDAPEASMLKKGIRLTGDYSVRLTSGFSNYSFSFTLAGPVNDSASAALADDQQEEPAVTENHFVGIRFGLGSYSYPEVTVRSINFASSKIMTGVETVSDSEPCTIALIGKTVIAEGARIRIYNLDGACVAAGSGCLDTSGLSDGIYIVNADTNNLCQTIKISIR